MFDIDEIRDEFISQRKQEGFVILMILSTKSVSYDIINY